MTKTPKTTSKPANDNTTLQIVYGTGRLRNYVMQRTNTELPPRAEGDTGIVDMGKDGKFIGYAVLDEASNKFVFTKVRRLLSEEEQKGSLLA